MYIHTYIHTHICTYMHTYIHTYIKVALIIGSAIGIGQYWVSVTLSGIGFFLRPLPIMSPRARDVCK